MLCPEELETPPCPVNIVKQREYINFADLAGFWKYFLKNFWKTLLVSQKPFLSMETLKHVHWFITSRTRRSD
jgi:hypothetical protein